MGNDSRQGLPPAISRPYSTIPKLMASTLSSKLTSPYKYCPDPCTLYLTVRSRRLVNVRERGHWHGFLLVDAEEALRVAHHLGGELPVVP